MGLDPLPENPRKPEEPREPEKPRKTVQPDWSLDGFTLFMVRVVAADRSAWLTLGVVMFGVLQMFPANADDPRNQGLVATRPQEGHVVESDHGFMVAYKQLIPGTDIEFEMVPVPGDLYQRSQPFWIGKCEVTFREYREYAAMYGVFKANRNRPDFNEVDSVDAVSAPTEVYNPRDRFAEVASLDCPAFSMTLFAAKQYTKWLSLLTDQPYRLPLESEWMRACKAGGTGYFWKEEQLRNLAFFDLETDGVQPVGLKAPNSLGIHDMHGNVSEWVITSFPKTGPNHEPVTPTGYREALPPIWIATGGNVESRLEECVPERRVVVTDDVGDEVANSPR
ncbi:MAG: formylglycine-generating enzyme family protein, partial [Rhodopirellula sp. JB055]|uniref:formylglycine-generating enzyme family protein n=1 Tax=Rhodopirellula sp. JB055 TaxID=3342846 RepID=UPI00370B35BB